MARFNDVKLVVVLLFSFWNVIEAQREFTVDLLTNFPAYLRENELDPTDIMSKPIEVRLNGIDAEFSNYQVSGHSLHNVTVQNVLFEMPGMGPGTIDVFILLGDSNMTITGDYKINGTVNFNSTVSGEGRFTARPEPGSQYILNLRLINVHYSDEGPYLTFDYVIRSASFNFYGTKAYTLEGFSAGGQEDERVKNAIMNAYFGEVRREGGINLPVPKQLAAYVEQVIGATPISDLVP